MPPKTCGRCGYKFQGEGILCTGCQNGHGSNRNDVDTELTKALDEIYGYTPPPEENDEDE